MPLITELSPWEEFLSSIEEKYRKVLVTSPVAHNSRVMCVHAGIADGSELMLKAIVVHLHSRVEQLEKLLLDVHSKGLPTVVVSMEAFKEVSGEEEDPSHGHG